MRYDLGPGCYTGQTFQVTPDEPLELTRRGLYAFESCKFVIRAETQVTGKLVGVRAKGLDMLRLTNCEVVVTGTHVGKLYAVEAIETSLFLASRCIFRADDMGPTRLMQATLGGPAVFQTIHVSLQTPNPSLGRDLKIVGAVASGPSVFENIALENLSDAKSAISLVRASGYLDEQGVPRPQSPVFVGKLRYTGIRPQKLVETSQVPPVIVVRQ